MRFLSALWPPATMACVFGVLCTVSMLLEVLSGTALFAGLAVFFAFDTLGRYMAYKYYFKLFKKIQRTQAATILEERVRIPNRKKARILVTSYVRHNLNIL